MKAKAYECLLCGWRSSSWPMNSQKNNVQLEEIDHHFKEKHVETRPWGFKSVEGFAPKQVNLIYVDTASVSKQNTAVGAAGGKTQ